MPHVESVPEYHSLSTVRKLTSIPTYLLQVNNHLSRHKHSGDVPVILHQRIITNDRISLCKANW